MWLFLPLSTYNFMGFGFMFGGATGEHPVLMGGVVAGVCAVAVGGVCWLWLLAGRFSSRWVEWFIDLVTCTILAWALVSFLGTGAWESFALALGVAGIGLLWFLQDLRAIDYCISDKRDAWGEWAAAWCLVFDLLVLVAGLARAGEVAKDNS
ncbi:hypothetical protein KIM372_01620 [Bombiscardovia nodaiensis]|uniref:Uncharacterized protein n=1 Tax=Bombiscardovia nodaiensis TaxID=2932181 RepID=A0ABM8B6G5_9BIFI|nr:hypothetical protein KIM372_01620 [Bombiscardovia nodaiensis]